MSEMYATLTEVKAALDDGTLPEGAIIELDNDRALMWANADPNVAVQEPLWRGDGSSAAVEQALDALGLRWRDV